MAFYQSNLALFVVGNAALLWHEGRSKGARAASEMEAGTDDLDEIKRVDSRSGSAELGHVSLAVAGDFQRTYSIAFLLASAGDWMQGPLIYAVYRFDKQLSERTVAALYACGFVSAALASSVVGQLADKHGRRKACLLYCALYSVSCACTCSSSLPVLFLGRVLGGICTTLLYSVFDAWMITEHHARDLEFSDLSLSGFFSRLTSLNCVVAIASGILGEAVATFSGSRETPFLLAAAMFVVTAIYIARNWNENYGSSNGRELKSAFTSIREAASTIWHDKRILALATTIALFESMMFLFIFHYTSAITDTRRLGDHGPDAPLGIIFACFMGAMMFGSNLYTASASVHTVASTLYVLKVALLLASIWLMSLVLTGREDITFYALCMVEFCIGLYYPCINFLKSRIIGNDSRAAIYSLMRLPLNGLVILAHYLAREGTFHRNNVFLAFGGGLLIAFVVLQVYTRQ